MLHGNANAAEAKNDAMYSRVSLRIVRSCAMLVTKLVDLCLNIFGVYLIYVLK